VFSVFSVFSVFCVRSVVNSFLAAKAGRTFMVH
jgi:hypothetical protein